MYLAGLQFRHIPECLYFYRVHAHNTVATRNPEIRAGTTAVYNRCIWALAEKWARDQNLLLIDLCGGLDAPPGYRPVDRDLPAGVVGDRADLDGPWPYQDSSVGLIRAHDAIEHLRDPVHTMNEAWRCLAPGGFFLIDVPSTNGQGAFCDPTHKSFFNQLSFRYYTSQAFARYVPAFKGRFQSMRVIEWFPDDWHKANNIPYVEAHLIALKPGYQPMGELLWDRTAEAAPIPIHAGKKKRRK
jgi:SAM-dependent methyltransferase